MAAKKKKTMQQAGGQRKSTASDEAETTRSSQKEQGESSQTQVSASATTPPAVVVGYNELGEELVQPSPELVHLRNGPVTRNELMILKEFDEATRVSTPSPVVEAVNEQAGEPQEEQGNPPQTTWAGVVTGSSACGVTLDYLPPVVQQGKRVAKLLDSELKEGSKKWENALIVYIVDLNPSLQSIRSYISRTWKNIVIPDVLKHDEGYYIVKFASWADKHKISSGGPYFFGNRPLIMKEWSVGYKYKDDVLHTVPLWVRLPNLPLHCWSKDSLSRIGSLLGTPKCADEYTSNQSRISFARLMVEMDVSKPLPKSVWIEGSNGQEWEQKVLYEWAPRFCAKCNVVGHDCAGQNRGRQVRRVWRPKAVPQPEGPRVGVAEPGAGDGQGAGTPVESTEQGADGRQAQQGDQVILEPSATPAQASMAIVPFTPSSEQQQGWQTVTRASGRSFSAGVRTRILSRRQATPLTFSNAYLALIEEVEGEGEDPNEDNADAREEGDPPSGSPYLS